MTTIKRTILPLLLVTFSSLTFANTISEEAIKKALEGVKTIRVMGILHNNYTVSSKNNPRIN
jgi:hypothetical protein